jgi:hypothetical protein
MSDTKQNPKAEEHPKFMGRLVDGTAVFEFSNPSVLAQYSTEQADRNGQTGHIPPPEPPPADDQADDGMTWWENAVKTRATQYKIEREARQRVDDEMRPPAHYPPVRSLTAMLAEPDIITRYRIDDVAPVDARIMLSAQYKAGKSTLVGNLIRALVDGEPFLGHFTVNTTASGVVLIDDEMSDNTLRSWLRAQNICNTDRVADVITLRGNVTAFNLLDEQCLAAWVQRLHDVGCDYLILDCLRPILDSLGLDEHRDAGRFLVTFDALLTEAGIRDALLIQHMGHANERARGDSRLQDWPDAIWRLVREDDDPASPRYFTAYGRDVNVAEGHLAFDPPTRHLSYSAGSRRDGKAEAALRTVIALLAADAKADGDGLSGRAIETEADGEHSRQAIRDGIRQAVEIGLVTVHRGARRAKIHRIAHPCEACGMPVTGGGLRHEACPAEGSEGLF